MIRSIFLERNTLYSYRQVKKVTLIMSVFIRNIPKLVAYVRKPAESILSTKKITTPIQQETLRYAGTQAQEQMPIVFKIHNGLLKKLLPKEQEQLDSILWDIKGFRFKNLPSVSHLNENEREILVQQLNKFHDVPAFVFMSLGARPAMVTTSSDILLKVKSQNFDTLLRTLGEYENTFIFNKKATLEHLAQNRSFYTQRLNLPKNTPDEDIYKILTGENSPLKDEKKGCDLIGLLFGFPKKNSMIYKLERDTNLAVSLRPTPEKFKKALLKELHSPDCVYAKFDDSFKKDLEDTINSITTVGHSRDLGLPYGYTFVKFADETPEIVKINQKLRKILPKLEKINAANKKARDDELISSLADELPQKELEDFIKSLQEELGKIPKSTAAANPFEGFI